MKKINGNVCQLIKEKRREKKRGEERRREEFRVSINVRAIDKKKEVESVIVEGSERDREIHGEIQRERVCNRCRGIE